MAECETRQAVDGRWYTQEEFREYYKEHAATMWRQARQAQQPLDPRVCDGVGPGASEHTADSDGAVDRGASEHTTDLTKHGGTDLPPSAPSSSLPPAAPKSPPAGLPPASSYLMGMGDIPELKRNCSRSREELHAEARELLNQLAVQPLRAICLATPGTS